MYWPNVSGCGKPPPGVWWGRGVQKGVVVPVRSFLREGPLPGQTDRRGVGRRTIGLADTSNHAASVHGRVVDVALVALGVEGVPVVGVERRVLHQALGQVGVADTG